MICLAPNFHVVHPWSMEMSEKSLFFEICVAKYGSAIESVLLETNNIICKFRELYYICRFRVPFRKWRLRQKQAMIQEIMDPKYLRDFLKTVADEDEDKLDEFLEEWMEKSDTLCK
jgi:hypothetical protein